ncbi:MULTISPECIES: stage IV sporulation protein A [Bacillales]|uniref:Stage IV sporulation protein A n=1 Tax=Lysinibacillus louembei TaxID=1470088 RepID=A0ABZ0S2H7_9BACI|nr:MULTISPECIES: stage IV sporulation protein A [Bacillales]MCT6923148.1 stage IV sporulation protein A [Metasolibacillus sp.]MCT6939547.1 stage IV sporulation protein A [Metasolibacillus sp.]WPK14020.1 stage IV sporulation protein A [Lysinibacillus louembei]
MSEQIFQQLAERTNGDVYIGVVGPVRVGKSTFVKKVMESLVLPNIMNEDDRKRALDELPQSSPGPVIMTAEPKFVPANAAPISIGDDGLSFRIRLADCVGYIIDGAKGYEDENGPKYVHTPWHTEAIPFQDAAKIGTDKVIRDHANIGVVVTTDGTVNGIERQAAAVAERAIIEQLKEIGKPFVIVINSTMPAREETRNLRNELFETYEVPVIATSIDQLTTSDIAYILQEALYEFPIEYIEVEKPDWVDVLDSTHYVNESLAVASHEMIGHVEKIRDVEKATNFLKALDFVENCEVERVDAGLGVVTVRLTIQNDIYKAICNEWLEQPIETKKDWLLFVKEASEAKRAQARFREAIEQARIEGYGLTLPTIDEFEPNEPELIKQNNFYGVRMKATAPSYHIIRVDMESEFAPLIGSEFHSQQLLKDLQYAFENDREALWQTQLFGTPLHEVLKESIRYKMNTVPKTAKKRMRQTIERMVNEGDRGLITFII